MQDTRTWYSHIPQVRWMNRPCLGGREKLKRGSEWQYLSKERVVAPRIPVARPTASLPPRRAQCVHSAVRSNFRTMCAPTAAIIRIARSLSLSSRAAQISWATSEADPQGSASSCLALGMPTSRRDNELHMR